MNRSVSASADYKVIASFIKDNSKDISRYSTVKFCKYLNGRYGNIVSLDFIELLGSELINRDLTNRMTYNDIFTKMMKDPFMSEKTTLRCIETDRKIHNLDISKNIINDFENWING